jgi:sialate O-acetylesterase
MKKMLTPLLSAFSICFAHANVTLPAVIGSNMVLQQKIDTKLWGWGNPLEKVYVTTSWDNRTDSTIVPPEAQWKVPIHTPAAGGPYTITIKASNTIVLTNVLVGEVWVCSGQSNMEMSYTWGMPNMTEDVPKAFNNNIHFFTVAKASSDYPQDDCHGQWAVCDSNTVKTFSAAAYYFGKKLNGNLNIPIGLINTSWGATAAEVWTPSAIVEGDAVLKEAAAKLQPNPYCAIKPGSVYNTMIAPIINYPVAGAIWYQGESNTGTAASYTKLFTAMISSWRTAWGKDLPFYYVQIAPFRYGNKNIAALLREAQTKTMAYSNTGMVVIDDLVTDTMDIHPKNKRDVGYRLAGWALAETYHQPGIEYKNPLYKSIAINSNKAIISFDNADGGLTSRDKNITQLYIAGADKIFYPAQASIDHGKLVVWSTQVKQPVAVRYSFNNTAIGNLFGANGLPVNSFRTDDWMVDTAPL